eukprot:447388-Prymnesium_polylepis.2
MERLASASAIDTAPKITSRSACSMTIDFMAIHADRHSGADDSLGGRVLAVAAATEDGVADTRRSRAPRGGDVWSRHACEDCCSLLEPGGCGCVREWQFLLRLATPSASPWASARPPASRGTSTAL